MTTTAPVIKLGAVAYAPKVITIWEGFKAYFIERGYYFDYVLYSNYESLTEALIAGDVHLAWNSPLAFVRADRMARARGLRVESIAMRHTDLDQGQRRVTGQAHTACDQRLPHPLVV